MGDTRRAQGPRVARHVRRRQRLRGLVIRGSVGQRGSWTARPEAPQGQTEKVDSGVALHMEPTLQRGGRHKPPRRRPGKDAPAIPEPSFRTEPFAVHPVVAERRAALTPCPEPVTGVRLLLLVATPQGGLAERHSDTAQAKVPATSATAVTRRPGMRPRLA